MHVCGCSQAKTHSVSFFFCFAVPKKLQEVKDTYEKSTTHSHPVACYLICLSLYQFLVIANSNKGSGPTVTDTVGTETAHYTIIQSPSHSFVVISPLPLLPFPSSSSPSSSSLPLSLSCMFFQSSMKSQPILLLACQRAHNTSRNRSTHALTSVLAVRARVP